VSSHLVVFVKAPVPGTVKTRLTLRYTPQQAADIYRAFVQDVLLQAQRIPVDLRVLAYSPPGERDRLAEPAPEGWVMTPQADTDLGGRMASAAAERFNAGAERVVIIGTDAPTLPDEYLTRAFDLLQSNDIVVGPSTDGGYYLVGLASPISEIFRDIDWSSERVLGQTVDRVRAAGLTLGLLPPWYDVDTPDELEFLRAHLDAALHAGHPFRLPNTFKALQEHPSPVAQPLSPHKS
jgi:uncharacterized protein